jgi:hypothetical protein
LLDANKQLLVILDNKGQMVGRKLLAIAATNQLLGYRLYLATDGNHDQIHEAADVQVANYCRDLADRTGLMLCDQGAPQRINGTAWYDDGPVRWTGHLPL